MKVPVRGMCLGTSKTRFLYISDRSLANGPVTRSPNLRPCKIKKKHQAWVYIRFKELKNKIRITLIIEKIQGIS